MKTWEKGGRQAQDNRWGWFFDVKGFLIIHGTC